MSWLKVEDGVFAKETDNPAEIVILVDKYVERDSMMAKLDEVADDIVHDDKDYEIFKNIELQRQRDIYIPLLNEINDLIVELERLSG